MQYATNAAKPVEGTDLSDKSDRKLSFGQANRDQTLSSDWVITRPITQ
jgi:hypothetical protein